MLEHVIAVGRLPSPVWITRLVIRRFVSTVWCACVSGTAHNLHVINLCPPLKRSPSSTSQLLVY